MERRQGPIGGSARGRVRTGGFSWFSPPHPARPAQAPESAAGATPHLLASVCVVAAAATVSCAIWGSGAEASVRQVPGGAAVPGESRGADVGL